MVSRRPALLAPLFQRVQMGTAQPVAFLEESGVVNLAPLQQGAQLTVLMIDGSETIERDLHHLLRAGDLAVVHIPPADMGQAYAQRRLLQVGRVGGEGIGHAESVPVIEGPQGPFTRPSLEVAVPGKALVVDDPDVVLLLAAALGDGGHLIDVEEAALLGFSLKKAIHRPKAFEDLHLVAVQVLAADVASVQLQQLGGPVVRGMHRILAVAHICEEEVADLGLGQEPVRGLGGDDRLDPLSVLDGVGDAPHAHPDHRIDRLVVFAHVLAQFPDREAGLPEGGQLLVVEAIDTLGHMGGTGEPLPGMVNTRLLGLGLRRTLKQGLIELEGADVLGEQVQLTDGRALAPDIGAAVQQRDDEAQLGAQHLVVAVTLEGMGGGHPGEGHQVLPAGLLIEAVVGGDKAGGDLFVTLPLYLVPQRYYDRPVLVAHLELHE